MPEVKIVLTLPQPGASRPGPSLAIQRQHDNGQLHRFDLNEAGLTAIQAAVEEAGGVVGEDMSLHLRQAWDGWLASLAEYEERQLENVMQARGLRKAVAS